MAAFEYKFADGAYHKVNPQKVGEICERIEKEKGSCTPQDLINEGADPNSPLHAEFDWDDTIAAQKWRIEQARLLILHIRIVRSDDSEERQRYYDKGFVSTPGKQSAYVSLDTALHKEEYKKHLLAQAKRDCQCFIAKYRRLTQLSDAIDAMETFLNSN